MHHTWHTRYTQVSDFAVTREGSPEIDDKTVLETLSTAHNWPGQATSFSEWSFESYIVEEFQLIISSAVSFYFFFLERSLLLGHCEDRHNSGSSIGNWELGIKVISVIVSYI